MYKDIIVNKNNSNTTEEQKKPTRKAIREAVLQTENIIEGAFSRIREREKEEEKKKIKM